jgi:hypothetical protein
MMTTDETERGEGEATVASLWEAELVGRSEDGFFADDEATEDAGGVG